MKIKLSQCDAAKILVILAVCFFERSGLLAQPLTLAEQDLTQEKIIHLGIRINAPIDSVWSRFSTARGMEKFFAPVCIFTPEVLSVFEVFFDPGAMPGRRGAENNRILVIQEKKMISFTWDAPPQTPEVRKNRTVVAIRMFKTNENETLVTLSQTGWGMGPEWDATVTYFEKAWGSFVLPNLKYSLEVSPINWKDFPKNAPQNLKPADKI